MLLEAAKVNEAKISKEINQKSKAELKNQINEIKKELSETSKTELKRKAEDVESKAFKTAESKALSILNKKSLELNTSISKIKKDYLSQSKKFLLDFEKELNITVRKISTTFDSYIKLKPYGRYFEIESLEPTIKGIESENIGRFISVLFKREYKLISSKNFKLVGGGTQHVSPGDYFEFIGGKNGIWREIFRHQKMSFASYTWNSNSAPLLTESAKTVDFNEKSIDDLNEYHNGFFNPKSNGVYRIYFSSYPKSKTDYDKSPEKCGIHMVKNNKIIKTIKPTSLMIYDLTSFDQFCNFNVTENVTLKVGDKIGFYPQFSGNLRFEIIRIDI